MSDPQISRRCPTCGVSIRERAFFCPQCGNSLEEKGSDTIIESGPVTAALETPATAAFETNDTLAEVIVSPPNQDHALQTPAPTHRATATVKRAAAGAREAFDEDVAPKVEKLRRMSSVVLDEAAYDPSIRFLLVAAALFVVFLMVLILSKLIG